MVHRIGVARICRCTKPAWIFLRKGIGTEKNLKKSISWYQRAAQNGHGGAQNNLGSLYFIGKGVEKDLKKAIYWYEKAVENGHKGAQYNIGECYEFGNGGVVK